MAFTFHLSTLINSFTAKQVGLRASEVLHVYIYIYVVQQDRVEHARRCDSIELQTNYNT